MLHTLTDYYQPANCYYKYTPQGCRTRRGRHGHGCAGFFVQPCPNFYIPTYLWTEPDSEARRSTQLATVYSENQWLLDHWIPIIPTFPEEPYQPLNLQLPKAIIRSEHCCKSFFSNLLVSVGNKKNFLQFIYGQKRHLRTCAIG